MFEFDKPVERKKMGAELGLYWPVDNWDDAIDNASYFLEYADEYQFLKVPVIGQFCKELPKVKESYTWCGRASAGMVYDFWQLCLHPDDAKSHYVKMQKKNGSWNVMGADGCVSKSPNQLYPEYGIRNKSYVNTGNFLHLTAQMVRENRGNSTWVEMQMKPILESLRKNCPVIMYSRFSKTSAQQHIVVVSGFARFDGELWLLIHDPESLGRDSGRVSVGMYSIAPAEKVSSEVIRRWNEMCNVILLIEGDWDLSGGAVYFLKASHIFSDHCQNKSRKKEFFNFQNSDNGCAGKYIYFNGPAAEPVPDELIVTGARKPLLRFPVEYPSPSPLAYYTTSEQAVAEGCRLPVAGGFYPLGLEGHLHSGVHLPAPDGVPGVVAMAPGEIVAFRVGALDPASDPQKVLEAQGNWSNFVLLRHEYQLGKEKPQSFYSLAMHLAPLSWQQVHGKERLDLQIPWLARLLHARHGVLVKIPTHAHREDEDPVRVLSQPIDPSWVDGIRILVEEGYPYRIVKYWVFGGKEFKPASMEVPASTGLDDAVWVYLAPPPHKAALYKAIENGETVFLDGHFQAVETGEVLGKLMPFNAVAKDNRAVGASAFQARSFVHWEVFAKEATVFTGAADALEKGLLKTLAAPEDPVELVQKLQGLWKPKGADSPSQPVPASPLPPAYPKELASFYARCSHGVLDRVTMRLDLRRMPKPSAYRASPGAKQGLTSYALKVHFLSGKGLEAGETQTLTLKEGDWPPNGVLELDVPFRPKPNFTIGNVASLQIAWDDAQFEVRRGGAPVTELDALKETIQELWRDVIVVHDSEWTPNVAQKWIAPEDTGTVKPTDLAWWHGGNGLLKPGKATAGDLPKGLPSFLGEGKGVAAVHPVTWKWILELLHRNAGANFQLKPFTVRDDMPLCSPEEYQRYLVVLNAKAIPPCGGSLALLAVDQLYYASGIRGRVQLRWNCSGGSYRHEQVLTDFGAYGVVREDVPADIWGDWTLCMVGHGAGEEWTSKPVAIKIAQPIPDGERLKDGVHQPQRWGEGLWRWSIPWKERVGPGLCGLVELVAVVNGERTRTGIAVPALGVDAVAPQAKLLTEQARSWKIANGKISAVPAGTSQPAPKGKKKAVQKPEKVTESILWSDWKGAANPDVPFTLDVNLACAVQDLLTNSKRAFTLHALAPDGSACTLQADDLERVQATAERLQLFQCVELEEQGGLRIQVGSAMGNASLVEFDLDPALEHLARTGLGGASQAMDAASRVAEGAGSLLGSAAGIGAKVPGGEAMSSQASQAQGTLNRLPKGGIEYTVAFHLVPRHLLPESEVSRLETSEFMRIQGIIGQFGTAPALPGPGGGLPGSLGSAQHAVVEQFRKKADEGKGVQCMAPNILGRLSDGGFGVSSWTMLLPQGKGSSHQLLLSVPLESDLEWEGLQPVFHQVGESGKQTVYGVEKTNSVEFSVPWTDALGTSLKGRIEAMPKDPDGEVPVTLPAPLEVALSLVPRWSRPRFQLIHKDLWVEIPVTGVRGCAGLKRLEGADRIELSLRSDSMQAGLLASGAMSTPLAKAKGVAPWKGFTYCDGLGVARLVIPNLKSMRPTRFYLGCKVARTSSEFQVSFVWDGASIAQDESLEFYNLSELVNEQEYELAFADMDGEDEVAYA